MERIILVSNRLPVTVEKRKATCNTITAQVAWPQVLIPFTTREIPYGLAGLESTMKM